MRKVNVTVTVNLLIRADDDVSLFEDVLPGMDYDFKSMTDKADIEDMEILDWQVTDSR